MKKPMPLYLVPVLLALLLLPAWAGGPAAASQAAAGSPAGESAPALPNVQQFQDVPDSHPYAVCINCVAAAGLMSGYACGGPGEPCVPPANLPYFRPAVMWPPTRAAVAQVIALGASYSEPISPTQQTYADVPPAHPAWLGVERVTLHAVMAGYGCGGPGEPCDPQNRPYFRPAVAPTRAQVAKTIALAAGFTDTPGGPTFVDVPPSNPFYVHVERVALHGVMDGYACGGAGEPCPGVYFRPNADLDLSRAQLAQVLARAFLAACAPYSSPSPTVTGTPPTATASSSPTRPPVPPTATATPSPTITAVPLTGTPVPASPTPTTPAGDLGSISGTVYAESIGPGHEFSGATVYAYGNAGGSNWMTPHVLNGSDGHYTLSGLAAGQYYVYAYPPTGSTLVYAHIGWLTLPAGGVLTNQDLILHTFVPLPAGVSLQPSFTGGNQYTVINHNAPVTLRVAGCPGGTASYIVLVHNTVWRGPLSLTEESAGSYAATVDGFVSPWGDVEIEFVITIHCPDGSTPTFDFHVYIDPSGWVRTTDGAPVPGATVTLYRSDTAGGSFDQVPNGSDQMSPMNRVNPDGSDGKGHYGWDVVPGYYKVRAERPGCYAPGNPSQSYVDSAVLTIPPAVTDLELRLECPATAFADVPDDSHPFWRFASWMASWNYVNGYNCGGSGEPCNAQHQPYFRPYSPATRGQFAKILANALRWADTIPADRQTFADVGHNNPYWLFVERVAAYGAISGYACGGPGESCDGQHRSYFRPGASITRGQIAKILTSAAQLMGLVPATQQTFADVPNGHPYRVFAERAAGAGLISGYACGGPGEACDGQQRPYFRPYSTATRGQIAKMIDLALTQH